MTTVYVGPITVGTNMQSYISAVVYVPDYGDSDVVQFLADNTPGGDTLFSNLAKVTPATIPHSDVYNLDNAGNRISIVESGGPASGTRTYSANGNPGANSLNQYTSAEGTAVTNGNNHQISTYQNTYKYINDTRLRQVTGGGNTYSLAYDALGRCVKRALSGNTNWTTFYYYDGEKPIQEEGTNTLASNIYGLGIDEIVVRFEPNYVYYFYQDHEGSITHVTDQYGLVEQYRYDAFGMPTVMDANGKQTTNNFSAIKSRFMFTGREWAPANLGFYEYRARAYHPGLGRFMSEDPKGFDAGDYNLFRYCSNDPLDLVDPMGTYGMGIGWTPEKWKQFDQAQKAKASQLSNSAAKLDKALADKAAADKAGNESKLFNSQSRAFEREFGKGTGTAENMAKLSDTYKRQVTALRDDGTKGYWAFGHSMAEMQKLGYDSSILGAGQMNGKRIDINYEHPAFSIPSRLSWNAGHESLHNFGFHDAYVDGFKAYKFGFPAEIDAFRRLPSVDPAAALTNPDTVMDFAR